MAERTLAEALAHAEKVRQVDSSQSIATYLEDYVVLADEVLRLRNLCESRGKMIGGIEQDIFNVTAERDRLRRDWLLAHEKAERLEYENTKTT